MVRYATVTKKGVFDSAHSNTGFGEGHKCARIHGHTFNYEVKVRSEVDEKTGLSIDFGIIKKAMKELVEDVLDHRYINDVPYFRENNIPASAENIASYIFEQLQWNFDRLFFISGELKYRAEIQEVVLNETPTSAVTITKDDFDYRLRSFSDAESKWEEEK